MKSGGYIDRIHIEKNIVPIYQKLLKDSNPIFIWGSGTLANHVHAYCNEFSIKVQGCFTNVVTGVATFQGLPMFELNELLTSYSGFSVILGHSNYETGMRQLKGIKNVKNIYCISALCYGINHLIPSNYIEKEREPINNIFTGLADDFSRGCLQAYFESRINDNAKYMFPYFQKGNTYYSNDILTLTHNELLLDVGACGGNAIWPFIKEVDGQYKGIIAVEPDEENFAKLQVNVKKNGLERIVLRKQCIYSENGEVSFKGEKEYGGICEEDVNCKHYQAITIDSLCEELEVEQAISIIKINFPFAVSDILQGAKSVLQKIKPKLIIRAGFDERVLLSTYGMIKKINPQYKIYLRYTIGMPQGLTLFAV